VEGGKRKMPLAVIKSSKQVCPAMRRCQGAGIRTQVNKAAPSEGSSEEYGQNKCDPCALEKHISREQKNSTSAVNGTDSSRVRFS